MTLLIIGGAVVIILLAIAMLYVWFVHAPMVQSIKTDPLPPVPVVPTNWRNPIQDVAFGSGIILFALGIAAQFHLTFISASVSGDVKLWVSVVQTTVGVLAVSGAMASRASTRKAAFKAGLPIETVMRIK